jgi:hypothetical protein
MSELGVIFLVAEILISSVQSAFYSTMHSLSFPVRMCEIICKRLWKANMIANCEPQVFHLHKPAYFCLVRGAFTF